VAYQGGQGQHSFPKDNWEEIGQVTVNTCGVMKSRSLNDEMPTEIPDEESGKTYLSILPSVFPSCPGPMRAAH
jgi:hypothetical protein